MDESRLTTIFIMGVLAYGARVLPQVLFVAKEFPEAWDRYLRYISYAFICSIIATTLFMTNARFESGPAPSRAAALIATILIARLSKSAVTGMFIGTILVLFLSWLR
jgi:branched-subunit amino acid transport protein